MTPDEVVHGSGWTVETLLHHIAQMFQDFDRRMLDNAALQQRMLDERAAAQQRAIDALALANDKALTKVDEKTEKSIGEIKRLIDDLKTSRDANAGRSQGVSTVTGLVLAIAGLMIGALSIVAAVVMKLAMG